ncbi:hypothetical protein FQR65_LT00899 [Abscondita terminalis]|nr:hypothetical protein FQR65_LT00899 [Abscondita terminalis]
MNWPSTRVPYGGLFHTPKVNYNPDTRDFLKVLINESTQTMMQRDKNKYNLRSERISDASRERSVSESRLSMRESLLIRPGSSKRRSRDAILNSGAYNREKFIPRLPKVDRDQAKRHLQDLMTYGKDIRIPPPPKEKPTIESDKPEENRFDQLEREIKERKEFLQEMRDLGKLALISSTLACSNIFWNPFLSKHLAAVILARGGSKGIRLKNLATVGNITLLKRTIDTSFKSKVFDSIWVSTENDLIFEEAEKTGVNIHWRPSETATDTASSLSAVREFLEKHKEIDIVALLQCTSPFLKTKYIQEAVKKLETHACVFSVTRCSKLRWSRIDGELWPHFDVRKRPRRQSLNEEYVENGMFYFSFRKLIEEGYFQNNR